MYRLGIYFWIRVSVMAVSLAAVVATIYKLNNPNAMGPMEWIASLSSSANKVKLCPTRVSSVSVIGKAALFQEDLKWYRTQDGQREELDPIAVEMWFSEYCTVRAESVSTPESDSQPVMTLAYVAGLPITLQQSESGIFTWNNRHFRSPKLSEAIQALSEIPTAPNRK